MFIILNESIYFLDATTTQSITTNLSTATNTLINDSIDWSPWYTYSCFIRKIRKDINNASNFEIFEIGINDLGLCDRLDG